jgi:hypothetical protein
MNPRKSFKKGAFSPGTPEGSFETRWFFQKNIGCGKTGYLNVRNYGGRMCGKRRSAVLSREEVCSGEFRVMVTFDNGTS